MKPIVWLGDSLARVRAFPADAKRELGYQLEHVAKFREEIYVPHAFQKKSRKTARCDIELTRDRLRALIRERTDR